MVSETEKSLFGKRILVDLEEIERVIDIEIGDLAIAHRQRVIAIHRVLARADDTVAGLVGRLRAVNPDVFQLKIQYPQSDLLLWPCSESR